MASGAVPGNANPHVTDGPAADAVYIHLTGDPLAPGRTTIQASTPPGTEGFVALDWKDDRLVGIEILTPAPASTTTSSNRQKSTAKTAAPWQRGADPVPTGLGQAFG
jgi:Protein of unknown function (DUF2283)